MDKSLLNKYIEAVIVPLFPNMNKNTIFDPAVTGRLNQGSVILKLDAGPGRILSKEEFYERGLFILMGLPNATSVQQEMDKLLYGPFNITTREILHVINISHVIIFFELRTPDIAVCTCTIIYYIV